MEGECSPDFLVGGMLKLNRKVPSIVYSRRKTTESKGHCTQLRRDRQARKKKRKLSQFRSWTVHSKNTKETEGKIGSRLIFLFLFFLPSKPKQAHVKNLDGAMTHL